MGRESPLHVPLSALRTRIRVPARVSERGEKRPGALEMDQQFSIRRSGMLAVVVAYLARPVAPGMGAAHGGTRVYVFETESDYDH